MCNITTCSIHDGVRGIVSSVVAVVAVIRTGAAFFFFFFCEAGVACIFTISLRVWFGPYFFQNTYSWKVLMKFSVYAQKVWTGLIFCFVAPTTHVIPSVVYPFHSYFFLLLSIIASSKDKLII